MIPSPAANSHHPRNQVSFSLLLATQHQFSDDSRVSSLTKGGVAFTDWTLDTVHRLSANEKVFKATVHRGLHLQAPAMKPLLLVHVVQKLIV